MTGMNQHPSLQVTTLKEDIFNKILDKKLWRGFNVREFTNERTVNFHPIRGVADYSKNRERGFNSHNRVRYDVKNDFRPYISKPNTNTRTQTCNTNYQTPKTPKQKPKKTNKYSIS